MNEEKEFYTTHELAKKLDLNVITIYRFIKSGILPAYKIGKGYRIDKKVFHDFLGKAQTAKDKVL